MAHIELDQVKAAALQVYEHKKESWCRIFKEKGYTLTDEVFEDELDKIGKYHAAASNYNNVLL